MGHIAPLDIQDPSDLDAILRDRRLSDLEVYVWEPTRKSIEYRHRLGAWRVAERKKARPDAEFWGPRSELYYQDEPDDIGTSGILPIKPDGIWQSLPPCSTQEYSYPRKLPDASIVVAEHEESVKEALCEQCANIPVGKLFLSEQSYKLCDKASQLDVNSCRLCRMIFRYIKKSTPSQDNKICLSVKPADGILSPRLAVRTGTPNNPPSSAMETNTIVQARSRASKCPSPSSIGREVKSIFACSKNGWMNQAPAAASSVHIICHLG